MTNASFSDSDLSALNRYADFTDVAALKEISLQPLRKSIRVNTLKTNVDTVRQWAAEKNWQLEPVPWCPEGFFVERENREQPLGNDLLHRMGHVYMQEASSMLPVTLLEPEPGDTVLDMAAAPGSKTTQIAAALQGRGVVVANDMQEKRLWTLKSAVYRAGATNVIITKKKGQWFAPHMTERFDKVLCDAPCTAQGTIRKDPTALTYTSDLSIGKAAALQRELLEAAVHACKVGGRIVYSTCTLTPEENEEVVRSILNKFSDQLECTDPTKMSLNRAKTELETAVKDSMTVQTNASDKQPCLRIWPQTYNTEGFFCAVLRKTARTKEPRTLERRPRIASRIRKNEETSLALFLDKRYDFTSKKDTECLLSIDRELFLVSEETERFFLPTNPFSIGMPYGKKAKQPPVVPHHHFATLRGASAQANTYRITDELCTSLLNGEDINCDSALQDHIFLQYKHLCIGIGRARNGRMKNGLPRSLVS